MNISYSKSSAELKKIRDGLQSFLNEMEDLDRQFNEADTTAKAWETKLNELKAEGKNGEQTMEEGVEEDGNNENNEMSDNSADDNSNNNENNENKRNHLSAFHSNNFYFCVLIPDSQISRFLDFQISRFKAVSQR